MASWLVLYILMRLCSCETLCEYTHCPVYIIFNISFVQHD